MKVMESKENYLETILILSIRNGLVRSIDIANELNFSKASVSVAMKNLREAGEINMAQDGEITLTDKGKEIASAVYEKHRVLTKVLTALGVRPDLAQEDACRIEHVISEESFEAIKEHIKDRI